MTMTFTHSISICIAALENGTPEGKRLAKGELLRYGRELDRLAAACGTAFDPEDTPIEGE